MWLESWTEVRQEKLAANVQTCFLKLIFNFLVSWTEAAKEGASTWRKWWKLIMAKMALVLVGRFGNATSVNIHPLGREIWEYIWKHTVEKSQTNAAMHHLVQTPYRIHLIKHNVENINWSNNMFLKANYLKENML